MMWLGRIEIYLSAPEEDDAVPAEADIQRQMILAVLVADAILASSSMPIFQDIENTIRFMVGGSDNVTLPQIQALMAESNLRDASDLLDIEVHRDFQSTLLAKPFAVQQILSQYLNSPLGRPDQVELASAFLLFGQRFIIRFVCCRQCSFR